MRRDRAVALVVVLACGGGVGCKDKNPDPGTLILELQPVGRPGLKQLNLPIQRLDLVYHTPPPDTQGRPHGDDEDKNSGRLLTHCQGLPDLYIAPFDPFTFHVDFPPGAPPETVAIIPAPVGEIYEIRVLFARATVDLDLGTANVSPSLYCSDLDFIVPQPPTNHEHDRVGDKTSGDEDRRPMGVVRIRPSSGTFSIKDSQQTEVRAHLDAANDLVLVTDPEEIDDDKNDNKDKASAHKDGETDLGDWRLVATLNGEVIPPATSGAIVNEWVLGFKAGTSASDVAALNAGIQAKLASGSLLANVVHIRIPSTVLIPDAYTYFVSNPHVAFAMINVRSQLMGAWDPIFPTNYTSFDEEIEHRGQLPPYTNERRRFDAVGAPAAWKDAIGRVAFPPSNIVGSHKVKVGIVDTGVALSNPDLIPNIWINQLEIPDDVRQRVYDCDCDGVITFIDLNWSSYFKNGPACTACPGVTDTNPGKFNTPSPTASNDDPFICKKDLHAPIDLCDPFDLISGTGVPCETDHGQPQTGNPPIHGKTCFTWDDGRFVANDGSIVPAGAEIPIPALPSTQNIPRTTTACEEGVFCTQNSQCASNICRDQIRRCVRGDEFSICDDLFGWDFSSTKRRNLPFDTDALGHGTSVASTVASARGEDGSLGITWNTSLVIIKANETFAQTLQAFGYAKLRQVPILNLSQGNVANFAGVNASDCVPAGTPTMKGGVAAFVEFERTMLKTWEFLREITWENDQSKTPLIVSAAPNCRRNMNDAISVFAFPQSIRNLANQAGRLCLTNATCFASECFAGRCLAPRVTNPRTTVEEDFNPERANNLIVVSAFDPDTNQFTAARGDEVVELVVPDNPNIVHLVSALAGVDPVTGKSISTFVVPLQNSGTSVLAPQVTGAAALLLSLPGHRSDDSAKLETALYNAGPPAGSTTDPVTGVELRHPDNPDDLIHLFRVVGK